MRGGDAAMPDERAARAWLRAGRIYLLLYPLLLLGLFLSSPRYQWVDLDYHFTLSAFMNHGTPDIRSADFEGATELEAQWLSQVWKRHPDPWYCLSKNEAGDVYGQHFWFWPLLCTPAALLFRALALPPPLAHSVTLALFFWLVLFWAWRTLPLDAARRFAFILMGGLGPGLFYLEVFGWEGFVYGAMLCAVAAMLGRRWAVAAAAAATASLQNTALAPYAALLALFCFLASRRRARDLLIAGLSLTPALVSPLFYLATFGRPTLFADIVPPHISDLSLRMFMTAFFDLNAGLVVFMPLAVALYFAAWARQIWRLRRALIEALLSPEAAMLLGSLLFPVTGSLWINWNSGYLGLLRQAVPLAPLLIGLIVTFRAIVAVRVGLATALLTGGWFAVAGVRVDLADHAYIRWGPLSRVALRYAPALCGVWTDEVMYERTFEYYLGHRELAGGYKRLERDIPVYPIVYADPAWGPRKILTTERGWRMFRQAFDLARPELFDRIDAAFAANPGLDAKGPVYFNLPAMQKAGPATVRRLPPARVRYAISADILSADVRAGEPMAFELHIANEGDAPLMPALRSQPQENAPLLLCGLARDEDLRGLGSPDAQVSLAVHTVRPLPDPVAPGETTVLRVTLAHPGPGYALFAALGQGETFFVTEPGHGWLRLPLGRTSREATP